MSTTYFYGRMNFGLLPEPEGRAKSFVTSSVRQSLHSHHHHRCGNDSQACDSEPL